MSKSAHVSPFVKRNKNMAASLQEKTVNPMLGYKYDLNEVETGDQKAKRMKDDYYKNFISINFYGM